MPRQPRCPTLTKPVSWPSRRRVLLTLQSSLLLIMMVAGRLQGQGVPVTRLEVPRKPLVSFQLREQLRIGAADGTNAFGRLMDARFDNSGRIVAVDDLNHRVLIYGRDGQLVASAGRDGAGPGEFRSPWAIGIDAADSIFIWDAGQSRISVLDRSLTFARSFRVAPHRLVNHIDFLPNGNLIMAAFGPGDDRGIYELDRADGSERRSLGPVVTARQPLAGFEASLLGGDLSVDGHALTYSAKSPYAVTFLDISGGIERQCIGNANWTTDVQSVVSEVSDGRPSGHRLEWNRFVHVGNLVSLGSGRWLNVIRDPVASTSTIDIVDRSCSLLVRHRLPVPLAILDRRGDELLAIRSLDYPELVVYRLVWR